MDSYQALIKQENQFVLNESDISVLHCHAGMKRKNDCVHSCQDGHFCV